MVPCTALQHPNQIVKEWNSSMSPYHYGIITLPNNVQKCYGCGQRFADCYRIFPSNLIIRHRDRRIMGMSITGQHIVNRDFQYTYYHLKRNDIANQNVIVQPTPAQDLINILNRIHICCVFILKVKIILSFTTELHLFKIFMAIGTLYIFDIVRIISSQW